MELRENNLQPPVDSGRGSDSTLNQQLRASIDLIEGGVDMPGVGHKCPRCSSTDRAVRGETFSDSSLYDFRECGDRWHEVPALISGRPYYASDGASQEVPEPLLSLIDGRLDLEITPAGVIGLSELAAAQDEDEPLSEDCVGELWGEPWGFGVDSLDQVRIFDSNGTLICRVASQSKKEALEWAERICAAVNFCAGLPEFDLAVSKPLTADFPFLRESNPSIQNAIIEGLKAGRA